MQAANEYTVIYLQPPVKKKRDWKLGIGCWLVPLSVISLGLWCGLGIWGLAELAKAWGW